MKSKIMLLIIPAIILSFIFFMGENENFVIKSAESKTTRIIKYIYNNSRYELRRIPDNEVIYLSAIKATRKKSSFSKSFNETHKLAGIIGRTNSLLKYLDTSCKVKNIEYNTKLIDQDIVVSFEVELELTEYNQTVKVFGYSSLVHTNLHYTFNYFHITGSELDEVKRIDFSN